MVAAEVAGAVAASAVAAEDEEDSLAPLSAPLARRPLRCPQSYIKKSSLVMAVENQRQRNKTHSRLVRTPTRN